MVTTFTDLICEEWEHNGPPESLERRARHSGKCFLQLCHFNCKVQSWLRLRWRCFLRLPCLWRYFTQRMCTTANSSLVQRSKRICVFASGRSECSNQEMTMTLVNRRFVLSALFSAIALIIHITPLSATAVEHVASPSAQQIQQSLVFIPARMAHYHVPGLSIACIHNGTVEWTRAFGVATVHRKRRNEQPVMFHS